MRRAAPVVVVVGSLVMDLVFRVRTRPRPGESMIGEEFGMFLGGKGFNQAVAAHRLGAEVIIVGCVGDDYFGDRFCEALTREQMTTAYLRRVPGVGTAVASPVVDARGANSIIAVPRANSRVGREDVARAEPAIVRADILLLQFEIPIATSVHAAELAHRRGVRVIVDPAPVAHGVRRFDGPVDYLVPNQIEAGMLAHGVPGPAWAESVLDRGATAVIVTRGARGARVIDRAGRRDLPSWPAAVIDTTGAGDAFRGGLAVELAAGRGLDPAVRFANACGALACTVLGAEPSMPTRRAVEEFIARTGSGERTNGGNSH